MAIKKSRSAPPYMWAATKMSEAQLQSAMVEWFQRSGWFVYFLPDWMYNAAMISLKRNPRKGKEWSPPGMPDLVVMQPLSDEREPRRVLFLELKSQKGVLREPQLRWIEGLIAGGQEAYCMKPTDWLDGSFERIMTGGPMPDHPVTIREVRRAQKKFGIGIDVFGAMDEEEADDGDAGEEGEEAVEGP